jgi:hypothetical protein
VAHYYPVVFQAGHSLAGDSLGFHAYSLRIDNLTNQWLLEETSLAWIPPYSLGLCLRLYGTGVAIILNQAPAGQPQPAPVTGEQTVGVYSDQLRTEVAGTPVRQFTLVQAVSDLTQGPQPAFPPVGITRLYAASDGELHYVLSTGTDRLLIDTGNLAANVATQPLGADLYGTINAGHIGLRYGSTINFYDSGGTLRPYVGITGGGSLIYYAAGGNGFYWVNQGNSAGLMDLDNSGNLQTTGGLTATGLQINGNENITGNIIAASGYMTIGSGTASAAGDIGVARTAAPSTGVIYLGNTGHYLYFDGTAYQLVAAPLNITQIIISGTGNQLSGAGGWAVVGGNNNNGQSFFCAGGAGGPTGWQIISTEQYKAEILVIEDALQIVLNPALHGHHYTKVIPAELIAEDAEDSEPIAEYGFIAEAWAGVAPDVVSYLNGKVHMMDYGQVNAILFEAFKQYAERTDARLAALEAAA